MLVLQLLILVKRVDICHVHVRRSPVQYRTTSTVNDSTADAMCMAVQIVRRCAQRIRNNIGAMGMPVSRSPANLHHRRPINLGESTTQEKGSYQDQCSTVSLEGT